ncbi:MAG: hypothetical protein ACRD23_17960 [Terriglobales bacterium]
MTEQEFVDRWWKDKFPGANPPTGASPITLTDALDLLIHFCKTVDTKGAKRAKGTHFLEGWWQRRFSTANPLEWDTFMTLADAENLLIQYRESADAFWPAAIRKAS